jgi:hypothetical protein
MLPVRTHAHAHTLLAMPSPRPVVSRPATRRDLGRWELDQESPCDRHGRSTFSDHWMPATSHTHRRPWRIAAGQRGDHGCLAYTPCRAAAGTPLRVPLSLAWENPVEYANAIRFTGNSARIWSSMIVIATPSLDRKTLTPQSLMRCASHATAAGWHNWQSAVTRSAHRRGRAAFTWSELPRLATSAPADAQGRR